jgi:hypothetical protein
MINAGKKEEETGKKKEITKDMLARWNKDDQGCSKHPVVIYMVDLVVYMFRLWWMTWLNT